LRFKKLAARLSAPHDFPRWQRALWRLQQMYQTAKAVYDKVKALVDG
jgi:hypothetical protein